MALCPEDYYCSQFQPNPFDLSRCGTCLRPGHMHLNSLSWVSQAEEDDHHFLSEVTSYNDVTRILWTNQRSLTHTPSPEWELNICDTDTAHSSQEEQWDFRGQGGPDSPTECCVPGPAMTRLDPSPHSPEHSSSMEEDRGRERLRRPSGSRGESVYFSPERKALFEGVSQAQAECVSTPPYRHYERGHPLPNNHSPEPKASIPYRTVNLGIPSQRRNDDTFLQATWRSESPQRYTYHSNFRRGGTESQNQSPSTRSPSPNRYKLAESRSASSQRKSSHSKSRASTRAPSHAPSHASSRHQSGRSSPSHRRGSVQSHHLSPSRSVLSYKSSDSHRGRNGDSEHYSHGRDQHPRGSPGSTESRRPSHNSNGHSLDSEILYKNLDAISRRGSTALQPKSWPRTNTKPSPTTRSWASQECSPPRSYYGTHNHSPQIETNYGSHSHSPQRDNNYGTHSHSPQRENNYGTHSHSPQIENNIGTHSHSPQIENNYGTHNHSSQRDTNYRDTRPDTTHSYSRRPERDNINEHTDRNCKTNHSPPQGSWRGSSHSLLSPAPSRGSSPPRLGIDTQLLANSLKPHAVIAETDNRPIVDRNKSAIRRGLEYLLTREEPVRNASVDSQGMTIEDYVILADIPRPDKGSDVEEVGLVLSQRRRAQSPSPRRDQAHRTPRYTEESGGYSTRAECDERGRGRERGRDRREKERMTYGDSEDGRSSPPPTSTVLHPRHSDHRTEKGHRSSKPRERDPPGIMGQKGWISRLDEYGEWRRHWFVMRDSALSFYRDSEAEESHDLDGEIDLTDCVDVLDLDVEKNYGFQIYTKKAVFTLSASTSRIRKSWVKVLRRTIQQPRRSPNIPQDSVSKSKGQRGHCRPPHQPSSVYPCIESDPLCPDSTSSARQIDSVESDRAFPDMLAASQREVGEGWDREQAKRLEERNKWFEEGIPFSDGVSRWESLQLKTASDPAPVTHTMDVDVGKKWAELESLSYREMTERSHNGSETSPTNETVPNEPIQTITTSSATDLQREASALRQQVKFLRKEQVTMGLDVDSPCGPGAPCGKRLEAMEAAHRRALQELQDSHTREVGELQRQRDRLLQEESQAATQVVEALKKAHKEELEREVEKAQMMAGGQTHVDTTYRGQTAQADEFHRELEALSERYTQKCLELNRAEQSGKDREVELNRMEKELEHLRKENQEIQARLTEEISRMRSFITGQRSGCVSPGNSERSSSELEILLRSKDNEVEYLRREVTCLRNEVQSLTLEKQSAWDRYKEVYVELSGMKGQSELEIREVKEHLRLANAALHDGITDT